MPPNKSLQVTFDPLPTFAVAKAAIASSAPERGRLGNIGSGGAMMRVRYRNELARTYHS